MTQAWNANRNEGKTESNQVRIDTPENKTRVKKKAKALKTFLWAEVLASSQLNSIVVKESGMLRPDSKIKLLFNTERPQSTVKAW